MQAENNMEGERTETKKHKRGNDYANYRKGARRSIMGLLLYVGIIPAKMLGLINWNERTLKEKAYFMNKEGVLAKENIDNEWVYRMAKMPKKQKEIFDLQTEFPKRWQNYKVEGAAMLRRARGLTWQGDSLRMIRNAEAVMFMDRLPVKYAPEDKGTIADKFEGNLFFTAMEMRDDGDRESSLDQYSYKAGYTRSNGVMFTEGGTFVVYNFSKNLLEFHVTREGIIFELAKKTALNHKQGIRVSAIALYRDAKLFKKLITRSKYYANTLDVLDTLYHDVYALPLTREGQELAAYMCVDGWEEAIRDVCGGSKFLEVMDYRINSDGKIEMDENGEKVKKYAFVFCIPNITRFKRFIDYINAHDHPKEFVIVCFDFQVEEVMAVAPRGVDIRIGRFIDFKERMKEKHNR